MATTRRYDKRLRAQSADGTRRGILDAVRERLREAPSEPVSVDRVARMAGVARSTVYVIFGSRAGLFDAVGDDLLKRDAYARLLEAVALPDARESLRKGMRAGVDMFAQNRDLARALYSMAQLDADAVGGAVQRIEVNRTAGMKRLARRLREQDELLPGVTEAEAANVLWMLTSFDAFDQLYTGRGLSAVRVWRFLVETAERSVCRPRAEK